VDAHNDESADDEGDDVTCERGESGRQVRAGLTKLIRKLVPCKDEVMRDGRNDP